MFRLAQYLESVLPGPVQFLLFVAAILVVGMLLGFVGLLLGRLMGRTTESPPAAQASGAESSLCVHQHIGINQSNGYYCRDCRATFPTSDIRPGRPSRY
jgi:hypothetical protein